MFSSYNTHRSRSWKQRKIYEISIVVNFTQCRQCSILTYSPCTPSRQIYNWWRGSNQHLKSKDRLPIKVFYFIKNNCSPQIHLMSVAFFLRTTANELVIVGNQSTVLRVALLCHHNFWYFLISFIIDTDFLLPTVS